MIDSHLESSKRRGYWGEGKSIDYIVEWLSKSNNIIRVATGFFTIKGYNSVRKNLKNLKLVLIVGIEEPGDDRARKVLVQEIMRELNTGLDRDRYIAVTEIVNKIKANDFKIIDARAMDHHGKLYIFDDKAVLVTSSNFTFRGLHERNEIGLPDYSPIEIHGFIDDFEDFLHQSYDITAELLEQLEQWLRFNTPWEIYLKTLNCLEDYPEVPATSKAYRMPVSYQKYLVGMALKGIETHKGYMIVAQTGLGKTVIGTEIARLLHEAKTITNVLVIGPSVVEDEWKEHLMSAGVHCSYLIQQNLHQEAERSKPLKQFLDIVERYMDEKWLIIVDECHMFRNRYKEIFKDGKLTREEQRAYKRLQEARTETNARILLLTGTPYAKSVDDVNYMLMLLPHTAPSLVLPGFEELLEDTNPRAWRIHNPEELKDLDIVKVITTPIVVRNWAHKERRGRAYIKFGEEKRYFPKILLQRVNTPTILSEFMIPILNSEILRLNGNYSYDKRGNITNAHIIWSQRAGVTKAWASSPAALQDRLTTVITKKGDNQSKGYKYSLEDRKKHIEPVLTILERLPFEDDPKLMNLLELLGFLLNDKRKVIVFCLYRSTVIYIENAIKTLRPDWKVFGTVTKSSKGNQSKPTKMVKNAIYKFAPISNNQSFDGDQQIGIFISTDRFGVGVNMQDADAVINYDLPWDAIPPNQRAGRILRPWYEHRVVDIYIFVPHIPTEMPDDVDFKGLEKHWQKLVKRHQASAKIMDLPVLTTQMSQDVDMYALGSVIQLGEIDYTKLSENEAETSTILSKHLALLEHNLQEANDIPDDIISAKMIDNRRIQKPHVFALIKYNRRYHTAVYNVESKRLVFWSDTKLLDMIEATRETERAWVQFSEIDQLGHECVEAWCKHKSVDPEMVNRICTLYLKPTIEDDSLKQYLG